MTKIDSTVHIPFEYEPIDETYNLKISKILFNKIQAMIILGGQELGMVTLIDITNKENNK